jgi:3-hydroxybutyryl-CoA dehydrogenase
MSVKRIAVLGAGIMGAGIAQVAAQVGLEVSMRDIEDRFIERGMGEIRKSLERFVKKDKMSQADADAAIARVKTTKDLGEAVEDVDLVIEAIPEDMELKRNTFGAIDKVCAPDVIFASNTSGLSITQMASATERADRFVGIHFFNPVPMMQLVEVVRGYGTSDETLATARELAAGMGKTSVVVNDTPGFITTRFIGVLQNEALHAYAEGIASAEDIDTAMKLGMNHPMGPLELADFVGLDTLLHCMDHLYEEYGDPKYRAPFILRQMVRAGHLGRKTGKGIYEYKGA